MLIVSKYGLPLQKTGPAKLAAAKASTPLACITRRRHELKVQEEGVVAASNAAGSSLQMQDLSVLSLKCREGILLDLTSEHDPGRGA